MTRDRSLDEFAGGGDATNATEEDPVDDNADGGERAAAATQDDVASATKGDSDDTEPATATYRWDPDGVECPACGATVDRLWSSEAGQVCAECKEW